MHILGLLGMPRRVYTYRSGLGWGTLNLVVTIGAFLFAIGVLLTLVNVVWSRRRGEAAAANPWGADTLEWATSSPPAEYNFRDTPTVASRHPLWDPPPATSPTAATIPTRSPPTPTAPPPARCCRRPAWRPSPSDSELVPETTVLPVLAAAGVTLFFVGLLVAAALVGSVGLAVGVVGIGWWTWRTEDDLP